MKFLADMGISPKTVTFLRGLEYDASHLCEQGLHRLLDSDILEKVRNEGRILLTHNLGFGELVAASGARLPSVISFRLRNMHPDQVNRYLYEIIEQYREALEQGVIISVTEGQVRVRYLPIKI
jgi:predicted nuclease of predicted toxin-antitoxin system